MGGAVGGSVAGDSVAGGSVEGLVVGVDAASVGEVSVVFCVAKIGSVSDVVVCAQPENTNGTRILISSRLAMILFLIVFPPSVMWRD